jgi:hypothetical protein
MKPMSEKEIRIDISKFEKKEKKRVRELEEFLKKRFGEVEKVKSAFLLKARRKKRVRNSLRKFLHKSSLKEKFRVIAGEREILVIKERKGTS